MSRPRVTAAAAVLTASSIVAAFTATAHAAALPQVENLTGLTGSVDVAPGTAVAQVFTAATSADLSSLTLPLRAAAATTLTASLDPVETTSGTPVTSSPVAQMSLSLPAATDVTFATVALQGTLTAGQQYAIVLSNTTATVQWAANTTSALPPVETAATSTSSWAVDASRRAGFAVDTAVPDSQLATGVTTQLVSGTLGLRSIPRSPQLPSMQLTGLDQTTPPFALPIDVNDATGSGAGWTLSVQPTVFTASDRYTLPSDALHVVIPASAACDASAAGCVAGVAGDAGVDEPVPAGAATPIFSAATNTGLGAQTVSPSFSLHIPAGAHAGQYQSVWTVTVSSGP